MTKTPVMTMLARDARRWMIVLVSLALSGAAASPLLASPPAPTATVEERVTQHGAKARARLAPFFETQRMMYPPRAITLVGLKKERRLLLYATSKDGATRFIRSYDVLAASGRLGPKLAEGDFQVPEGVYGIELLNPNSRFHLSLRVDYPNRFDRQRTREEGRDRLGGDIMIHGGAASTGCLAIGDRNIEELFVLAADVGAENISVILSPVDLRSRALPRGLESSRPWARDLYADIRRELARLPAPVHRIR